MEKSNKNKDFAFVTVVMAVYNAAQRVSKSIDSVLNQTYTNWLMICVNDGSTDNSLEILENYAQKDPRITVISQKNGGPAAARASAYKVVTTPYVTFLDSDDLYSPDMLECLVETANRTGADIVIPNMLCELPNGAYMNWNVSYGLKKGMILSGLECFSRTFIEPSIHGVNCWRTELVKKFALDENASYNNMNADEYIQRLLFLNSNKVAISGGSYYYHCNMQSITKSFSVRQLGYLDSCRRLIGLINEYNLDESISSIIREYFFRHVLHLQIRLFRDSDCLTKQEYKFMKLSIKAAYKEAMHYKNDICFKEKRFPILYKFVSVNGYWLFIIACFVFAKYNR